VQNATYILVGVKVGNEDAIPLPSVLHISMEVTGTYLHLAKCLIALEWPRPEISSVKLPCVVFKASINYSESYE
jgi:hypothetical protein